MMKSKIEVLREHVPHCIWGDEGGSNFMLDTVPASLVLNAMEDYAQPLAKEVIDGLEEIRPTGTETTYYNMGIDAAIALIKSKFGIV